MPTTKAKAEPVLITSAVIDCMYWCDLKSVIKEAEKKLASLKARIEAIVPAGRQQERFEANRNGVPGEYVITNVEQDRRVPDGDKLITLMKEKLTDMELIAACDLAPNMDAVAELVNRGTISKTDFEACLKGKQVRYTTVEFKPF